MALARHLGRGGSALVALVLLLAACTGTGDPPVDPGAAPAEPALPPAPPPSSPGGTLRIGVGTDPVSLDPRFLADDEGELIVDAVFDPLVRLDEDLQVVGAAAHRWRTADDHRTFIFELREASFHDGTPVTAQDFVRTFDWITDGTAARRSYLSYLLENVEGYETSQQTGARLSGVEATDERTLVIRLQTSDPGFLETLTDPSLVPLPPQADEDVDGFGQQPIGNGPFALVGPREPNAFIRLARFEDYRDPALLDEVLITVYAGDPGRDRQWRDVEEGTLHVAELSAERLEQAAARYGRSPDGIRGPGVVDGVSSTVYLYGFDTTTPPFDDARVRRAVSMSIDRQALAAEVTQGTRVPATSLVPPSIPGARPGACGACSHDPDRAKDLLDEVRAEAAGAIDMALDVPDDPDAPDAQDDVQGFANDRTAIPGLSGDLASMDDEHEGPAVLDQITLTHNRGVTHAAIAERMASDISDALEIDVSFRAREMSQLVQEVRDGQVSVFRLGWASNEPNPAGYLRPLFHSSQRATDNLAGYARSDVDDMLDDARGIPDRRLGLNAYGVAERRILADLPVMPLLWHRHLRLVVPEVQNLVLSPLGRMNLADVWLDLEAADIPGI